MAGWQGQIGKEWPSVPPPAWIIQMWKESTLGILKRGFFFFFADTKQRIVFFFF